MSVAAPGARALTQPAIEASGLRVRVAGAGSAAARLGSWRVEHGAHAAIVGPSGCGKTTLLRAVAGILPASGTLRVLGTELTSPAGVMPERARRRFRAARLGLVFQHLALVEYLSLRDNILLPCRVDGRIGADDRARAAELIERLGLALLARRLPHRLSQGERQRVALARALVRRPALVLADEPTASLDPALARAALDLMLAEVRAADATLVMVTHDHALLPRFESVLDATGLIATASPAPAGSAA